MYLSKNYLTGHHGNLERYKQMQNCKKSSVICGSSSGKFGDETLDFTEDNITNEEGWNVLCPNDSKLDNVTPTLRVLYSRSYPRPRSPLLWGATEL